MNTPDPPLQPHQKITVAATPNPPQRETSSAHRHPDSAARARKKKSRSVQKDRAPARHGPANSSSDTEYLSPNGLPQLPYAGRPLVHLMGDLEDAGVRWVKINDTLVRLDRRAFLILLALVSHSLAQSGPDWARRVSIETPPVAFLSACELSSCVTQYLDGLHPRPFVFLEQDPTNFTRVINDIRSQFEKHRLDRQVIGTGPSRRGYRLETAPHNVQLTYLDPRTGKRIHLDGAT